ncbi:hypothetical protein CEXT_249731 [Caerostris extrusa]|uniref:Uncharacterized protein n=1 Tax=Caerostris extrusa TaxID=172846 RepID=A0AAV4TBD9_CAEEX|nr:hypothetical protein CEXT_249731 [Caerostris extrusa]
MTYLIHEAFHLHIYTFCCEFFFEGLVSARRGFCVKIRDSFRSNKEEELGKKVSSELHQLLHPEEYSAEKLCSKWQLSTSTLQEMQVLRRKKKCLLCSLSLSRIGWNERMFSDFCRKFCPFFSHLCCYIQKMQNKCFSLFSSGYSKFLLFLGNKYVLIPKKRI